MTAVKFTQGFWLILLSAILPPACRAEIEIPVSVPVGTPTEVAITDEVSAEADAAYSFVIRVISGGEVHGLREIEGTNRAYIWGSAGEYEIFGVISIADLDGIKTKFYSARHTRTGDLAPDPQPPIDDSLADLVSNESAAILHEFHEDAAYSVIFDNWPSRAQFDASYFKRRGELKLADAARAYSLIDARLRSVDGVGEDLARELDRIAGEFAKSPQPDPDPEPDPDPQPGGSYELVIFAVTDDLDKLPAEQRRLLTSREVRRQLKEAGHEFLIVIDDDEIERNTVEKWRPWIDSVKGDPLPRVAIRKFGETAVKDYPLPASYDDLLKLLASPN